MHDIMTPRRAGTLLLAALLALPAALVPARAATEPQAETDWLDLAHKLDSAKKKDRIAAVQAAGATGEERASAYLRPILTADEDREVRVEAVKALRAIPGEDAVALLGDGLSDADLRVRKAAVEALRRRREDSAIPQLTRALSDKKPELRACALLALGSRLDAQRAALLSGGLNDAEASVREATIYALGAVGGETAIEALASVVAGAENKKTKALAAEVLSSMGSRSAIPALVAALDDADKDVLRPALETAIKKILAQTPARVKDEMSAPRESPRAEPEPAAVQPKPAAPHKTAALAKPAAAPAAKPHAVAVSSQPAAGLIASTTQAATAPVAEAAGKAHAVEFKFKAPQARSVLLAVDAMAGKHKVMVRSVDGTWSVSLPLSPGSHRYQFIVDGKRTLDPENPAQERGASLITVP
jgi:HEAT repeat protein